MDTTIEEDSLKCTYCENDVPLYRRNCHVCGKDIGCPNVRMAIFEETHLLDRYNSAIEASKLRGSDIQLKKFEDAISESKAVWTRPISIIIQLINSDKELYQTFGKQIKGNARLAENNEYDNNREIVESLIHPHYADEITCSALSLTDFGLSYYGNCHIILKTEYIKERSSVFEENPYLFIKKHGILATDKIPNGYRATWGNKAKLAVAKLYGKIDSNTKENGFQSILLSDDGENSDFIEVHIFGALHAKAFKKICLHGTLTPADKVLFESHRKKIVDYGIELSE